MTGQTEISQNSSENSTKDFISIYLTTLLNSQKNLDEKVKTIDFAFKYFFYMGNTGKKSAQQIRKTTCSFINEKLTTKTLSLSKNNIKQIKKSAFFSTWNCKTNLFYNLFSKRPKEVRDLSAKLNTYQRHC